MTQGLTKNLSKMVIDEKISVILPTYNEKSNILLLIESIHSELSDYDHEILVVDDDSPDGTYQTVLKVNYPYVKAILRTENRGFANSIRCGLENAKGNIFVIMDSDFNHQPEYLPFMIQALSYYDCVSASRFLYGGKMNGRLRHILSWTFNIFIRLMTGGAITDTLYGFFAIKRKIIEQCNYNDIFWGYGDYFIRLLYHLQKNKVRILQFPAINGERKGGVSNRRFLKTFCQYFVATMRLAIKGRIRV